MTFWSVLLIELAFMVFMFGCTKLMECIRSHLKQYPIDEWKGSVVSLILSIVLLLGCVIASCATAIHCPNCHTIAVRHYCKYCDIDVAPTNDTCPSCNKTFANGFCVTCGITQE